MPKITITNTKNLFLKTVIGIYVISIHNSFRVLLDKIASVYFICVISYGTRVPVAVRLVANCYTLSTFHLFTGSARNRLRLLLTTATRLLPAFESCFAFVEIWKLDIGFAVFILFRVDI